MQSGSSVLTGFLLYWDQAFKKDLIWVQGPSCECLQGETAHWRFDLFAFTRVGVRGLIVEWSGGRSEETSDRLSG